MLTLTMTSPQAFPPASWKTRASDTPLRTVKTVLHSLATIFGYQVLSKVGLIENAHRTELLAYLVKVVSSTGGEPTLKLTAPASAALSDRTQMQAGGTSTSSSSPAQKPSGKRTHDQLSEIFKMIGSKENTKEVGGGGSWWKRDDCQKLPWLKDEGN